MNGLRLRCSFSRLLQLSLLALPVVVTPIGLAAPGEPGAVFAGVSLSVASPTVPPGGMLQMQVSVTEPKPILKGKQGAKFASVVGAVSSPLGAIRSAALFSSGGDVSGVAVLGPSDTQVYFSSPLTSFGMTIDTPVMTIEVPVRKTATVGQSVNLTLDPNSSLWYDPNSTLYPVELKSGTMTVGGSLSIADVNPGAGVVQPGTVISIKGVGFQPTSRVDVNEGVIATSQYISPNEMQVTFSLPLDIRGKRIRVTNDNNERATYYPYQRTAQAGKSTHALVAASYPLFSQRKLKLGYFRPQLKGTMFSGLALQNLNPASATFLLQLFSSTGVLLAQRNLSVAPNTRIARDLVELFPGAVPGGGTELKVSSNRAVQMLGLLGDDASGIVLPVLPSPTP